MRYLTYRDRAWRPLTPRVYENGTWHPVGKQTQKVEPVSGTARWPEPIDEIAAGFRPTLPAAGTFEVGPDKKYKKIMEAVTAAQALRGTTVPAPDNRLDILIHPGTYQENIKLPMYCSLIGVGTPEQVVIRGVSDGPYVGIIDTPGAAFIENLSIIHPAENARWSPKYPVHAGHSGVLTFINCVLDGQASASGGGGTAFGADGGYSGWVIGYKSRLVSAAPAATTNSHGPNGGPGVMADYWIDCSFSNGVGINSIDDSRCQVHVLGASQVAGSITVKGAGASAVIGTGVQVTGARPGSVVVSDELPVLVEGMNPVERRAFYGG